MKKTIVKKYVIYCRFSPRPKEEAEKSESLETQEEVCRAYVKKHGGIVVAVYGDPELSGADEERPGLWDAVAALKPGYVLLAWKSDRLARSVWLSEYLVREVKFRKASIETVDNGEYSDDPDKELIRRILQAFDDYARRIGNYRTKHSMLRHQKDNRPMSAEPPYGKRLAKGKGPRRWEDDPKEMKVVERILTMRNVEAKGYREIAALLNHDRVPSRGAEWSHVKIIRICNRADGEAAYVKR